MYMPFKLALVASITKRSYHVVPSKLQTKTWRKNSDWYRNGHYNECELYQVRILNKIVNNNTTKTNERINIETYDIESVRSPLTTIDGFEWTENFDRFLVNNNNNYYFNIKFICDSGGSQTRALREVYHFISYQIKHIIKYKKNNTYFINILDGDCSHKYNDKFKFLINKNKDISKYFYVGDSYNFRNWWKLHK